MPGYAVAHLHAIDFSTGGIAGYLERIDETLAPFGGKFLVHGHDQHVLEGPADGTMIVLEFPDQATALAWYHSPEYQAILPLRTENSTGAAAIAAYCGDDHRATDVLKDLGHSG